MRRNRRLDDFFIGSAVRDDALALPALMRSCAMLAAIVVALLIVLGLLFALWGTHVWNRNREALHGQLAQVQPLVAALEAYHQDYAAYPPTLHALVPKYLPEVPAPPFSFQAEWWYSPYPGDLLRWASPPTRPMPAFRSPRTPTTVGLGAHRVHSAARPLPRRPGLPPRRELPRPRLWRRAGAHRRLGVLP